MDTELLTKFIRPELLILIPVLYLIGSGLKGNTNFDNKFIPLTLGLIGIALCIVEIISVSNITNFQEALGAVFTAITQGIMCAGASVYTHQLIKQHSSQSDAQAATQ